MNDDDDDSPAGFDRAGPSPLVRLLHQVFAQPVARLGDVAPLLLAGAGLRRLGLPDDLVTTLTPYLGLRGGGGGTGLSNRQSAQHHAAAAG